MTKEQMIQLLDDEFDAMNKHRSNIERIKKEYFDSVYGLKKGDKVSVLYKRSKEPLVGFFKNVQITNTGTVIFTIQKANTDLIKSLKLQIHELENLKFEYDD